MGAENDPFVGMLAAANLGDDVVHRGSAGGLVLDVEFHSHIPCLQRAGDELGIFHAQLHEGQRAESSVPSCAMRVHNVIDFAVRRKYGERARVSEQWIGSVHQLGGFAVSVGIDLCAVEK